MIRIPRRQKQTTIPQTLPSAQGRFASGHFLDEVLACLHLIFLPSSPASKVDPRADWLAVQNHLKLETIHHPSTLFLDHSLNLIGVAQSSSQICLFAFIKILSPRPEISMSLGNLFRLNISLFPPLASPFPGSTSPRHAPLCLSEEAVEARVAAQIKGTPLANLNTSW